MKQAVEALKHRGPKVLEIASSRDLSLVTCAEGCIESCKTKLEEGSSSWGWWVYPVGSRRSWGLASTF